MTIDYITVDGNKYMTRDVRLEEYKVTVKVAQEELDSVLFSEKDGYASREAELIDELIYTFIPASMMEAPEAEIAEYIYDKNEEMYCV